MRKNKVTKNHMKFSWLPHTNRKSFNVLIVIIIIVSLIGIATYAVSAVRYCIHGNLGKMFPYVMYVLSYISIISFSRHYFIKKEFASIYPIVANFAIATLMSTLNLPNISNGLVALAIVIFVIASFTKKYLLSYKRCTAIIHAVFVLVLILTILKCCLGYVNLDTADTFELVISVYSSYRLVILWLMFALLYYMRAHLIMDYYKELVKKKGFNAAKEAHLEKVSEEAKRRAYKEIDDRIDAAKKMNLH